MAAKRGRPPGSKNKVKKKEAPKGRARKPWLVEVSLDGKRKGQFKGETLVEALIAAEEKILYSENYER